MVCPECDEALSSMDPGCVQCHRAGDGPGSDTMQESAGVQDVTSQVHKEPVSPTELAFNGAMAGVLYGAMLGALFGVLAHYSAPAAVTVRLGLAIVIGAAFASISGAIVGLITVDRRSVIAAIVVAVIAEAAIRLTVMNAAGLWWGLSSGGIALTLASGGIFGWIVFTLVMRSIDWTMVED